MATQWMKPGDAAQALQVTREAIYKRVRKGTMESRRLADGRMEVLCDCEPSPNPVDTLAEVTTALMAEAHSGSEQVRDLSNALSRQLVVFQKFEATVQQELQAVRRGRSWAGVVALVAVVGLAFHYHSAVNELVHNHGDDVATLRSRHRERLVDAQAESHEQVAAAHTRAARAECRAQQLVEQLDGMAERVGQLEHANTGLRRRVEDLAGAEALQRVLAGEVAQAAPTVGH